jgi:Rho termination factor, N-terminal domain
MSDQVREQASNTATTSQSELRETKADDLRAEAKEAGVTGTSDMRKDELVEQVAKLRSSSTGDGDDVGAGPDGGNVRTGDQTSSSLKYSQEVSSPEEEPERAGRSLVTTHHQVIKDWAEERGGRPATVEGTEHGDHLGVLRIDFGGDSTNLRHVSWDEWFETFDTRRLNFIYQETTSDGNQSNFFRLESPDREDG